MLEAAGRLVHRAALDGLAMGIGFTLVLITLFAVFGHGALRVLVYLKGR